MNSSKINRDKRKGVVYFDQDKTAQREKYRVVIEDGIVYTSHGEVQPDSHNTNDDREDYVMDECGNFYVFDEITYPKVRHSSMFAGGPVAGAGEITIKDGRVVFINSNSGHYPSGGKYMKNVLKELQNDGVEFGHLD